ncbi:MAG: prolyl oligopeptidase family serine peptidase [Cyanobacteriota bacterium]|nr:prolyl oligopeptidase family serine peptidase [Cyanobacteriota bacterium]
MTGPLSAAAAVGRSTVLKEPILHAGDLYWLEQRPGEGGRTTLLRRRAGGDTRELTPGDWDLRSRVHGYGGGVYAVDGDMVVVVNGRDRRLWRLDPRPHPLVAAAGRDFGGGLIDRRRHRWLGVMEEDGQDWLVAVSLAGGEPQRLHGPVPFCADPALSGDGGALAWVQWQPPAMPWDRSSLWLASVAEDGGLLAPRPVAGDCNDGGGVSVLQPLWAGADLVVANDRSGWWNLERLDGATGLAADRSAPLPWQPLRPMPAEWGAPQWVQGLRSTAWDGTTLVAAVCREGWWQLGRLLPEPGGSGEPLLTWQPIEQPFNDLAYLSADAGQLVAVASHPGSPAGLLELELTSGRWRHTPSAPLPLPAGRISHPRPLWFSGAGGARTHAWYYPPAHGPSGPHPLLVKAHSGPTGMARTGFSAAIQFWTSRGWGVLDVNYGGSTGFGRAYRERLDGGWGVSDVADCEAAVAAGWTRPDQVAMEGGSAAGFTVLAALCFGSAIRAGACRYAVSDPAGLATAGDHRFEARYLDGLIGPWPAARALYEQRSPLGHAERITAPVIFFHGLDDQVVPPEQTERMAAVLAARGIPVQLHLFEGEGHGFRDAGVQQQVLEATEAFFRRHLGAGGAEAAPPA